MWNVKIVTKWHLIYKETIRNECNGEPDVAMTKTFYERWSEMSFDKDPDCSQRIHPDFQTKKNENENGNGTGNGNGKSVIEYASRGITECLHD